MITNEFVISVLTSVTSLYLNWIHLHASFPEVTPLLTHPLKEQSEQR